MKKCNKIKQVIDAINLSPLDQVDALSNLIS